MASARTSEIGSVFDAECTCGGETMRVRVLSISSDGCLAEAERDWREDFDFLRLDLPDGVVANGRVVRREGRLARIMFFGQIHPLVIAGWQRHAT